MTDYWNKKVELPQVFFDARFSFYWKYAGDGTPVYIGNPENTIPDVEYTSKHFPGLSIEDIRG